MNSFIAKINNFTKDYAHEPVPEDKRCGAWKIFVVWAVSMVCLPAMMLGFTVGNGLPFPQMVSAIILGQFILAVITSVSAYIGGKLHLPSSALLQVTFGTHGVKIISSCIALAVLGWYGFQLEVFTMALQGIAKEEFAFDLPKVPVMVVFGLLMSLSAIIGFKGINFISQLTVPFLLIILAAPIVKLWPEIDWNAIMHATPENIMPFGAAITMILGSVSLAMLICPDYSRYAKTDRHAVTGIFTATLFASGGFVLYAAFVMLITRETDFVRIMYDYGIGWPALFAIILVTWTTNDTNNYIGGLALTAVFPKAKKWVLSLICAFVGTAFAIIGVAANFVPWLSLMGVLFSPAAGAYIADYFMHKNVYKKLNDISLPKMRPESKIAWAGGVLIGWMSTPADNLGGGMTHITGSAAIDGLLIAVLIQVIANYVMIKKFNRFAAA
ncbi:MAG: hypothetical protein CL561_08595 [Alphaproteobacteria bacterium]|nr:hypothetical protein [Alphaproteobacteria bacterium]|tara:strand:+ start:1189 stop:2511 length:1323 start_codon:yes stop_codon:yes gene_type:complete